jgi:hypothetical protein
MANCDFWTIASAWPNLFLVGVYIGVTDYKSTALLSLAYNLDCYKTYSYQSMSQSKKGAFP